MPAQKNVFLKKGDVIVLVCVAVVALIVLLYSVFGYSKTENGTVEIVSNGKLYGTYPLSEDRELVIDAENGGRNTVIIEDGKVRVDAATCPDHLCEKQGRIDRRGQSVVCLPNGLVITVKDAPAADVDILI